MPPTGLETFEILQILSIFWWSAARRWPKIYPKNLKLLIPIKSLPSRLSYKWLQLSQRNTPQIWSMVLGYLRSLSSRKLLCRLNTSRCCIILEQTLSHKPRCCKSESLHFSNFPIKAETTVAGPGRRSLPPRSCATLSDMSMQPLSFIEHGWE
jgi:hypothetical protein